MDKECYRCGKGGTWLKDGDKNFCSSKCCLKDGKEFSAMVLGGCILLSGAFICIAVIVENVK